MDEKTQSFLKNVGDKVFKENIQPNVIREDTFAPQRESTEAFLRDPRLNRDQRRQVGKMLENEHLYRTTERIDPRAEQEADARAEAIIRAAIKSGKIPPPKPDAFTKRMEARMGDPNVRREYYKKHDAEMEQRFGPRKKK